MKKKLVLISLAASSLLAYNYSVESGWNLLGTSEQIDSVAPFFDKGDMIWVYDAGSWSKLDSNSNLKDGKGFWFKSNSKTVIDLDSVPSPSETAPTPEPSPTDTSSGLELTFKVVDTNQANCYDKNGDSVSCSGAGQDASYSNNPQDYRDNGDETVTDNVSGLMWQKSSDINGDGTINVSDKLSQEAAVSYCSSLTFAGYSDWRLPNIKQMYSLIDFSGSDISAYSGSDTSSLDPFINTDFFDFGYGDESANERLIDAQWATTTIYVSKTMNGDKTMFGVNLADGRIKGYPVKMGASDKLFYVQCIRENENYGINDFSDNGDDTISDKATGLTWQKDDSGSAMSWDSAISYCESSSVAGHSDWRLPNAKELQSILDYSKSPDTTNSAAIDSVFNATEFTNEEGEKDYGYYWSSTTHKTFDGKIGASAAYVSFGRALGYMNSQYLDVHGAGAQRSDPKGTVSTGMMGYESVATSTGGTAVAHGPQGDIVRGENYARCVR